MLSVIAYRQNVITGHEFVIVRFAQFVLHLFVMLVKLWVVQVQLRRRRSSLVDQLAT